MTIMCHRSVNSIIVLITILFSYQCDGNEISSIRAETRFSSPQRLDSSSGDHVDHVDHYHQTTSSGISKSQQKYQGWKPIVGVPRSVQTKYNHAKNQNTGAIKYRQNSKPMLTTEASRLISSDENRVTERTLFLNIQKLQETSSGELSKTPFRRVNYNKTINEDDIMRMHYATGLSDNASYDFRNDLKASKSTNQVNPKYHSQYRLDTDIASSAKRPHHNPKNIYEIIEQRNSAPKSEPVVEYVYQTSPSSWQRNFMAADDRSQASSISETGPWLMHTESIGENQARFEKGSRENDIYDIPNNEQIVKVDPSLQTHLPASSVSRSEQPYYTATATKMDMDSSPIRINPTKETSDNNSINDEWLSSSQSAKQQQQQQQQSMEKSKGSASSAGSGGKYSGKPIVIAEQVDLIPYYFTAEYYRKLFNSFDRQDDEKLSDDSEPSTSTDNSSREPKSAVRSLDTNETNSSKNQWSDSKATFTTGKPTGRIESDTFDNCTARETSPPCKNIAKKPHQLSHISHHKHRFNIFKFIGVHIKDAMPKTLRTNIYSIKKLLVECYTELQDQDPSPFVCLRKITTEVLDKAISSDIVKLTDNVSLIKDNSTEITGQHESFRSSSSNTSWLASVVEKLATLFSTHSLRVQLVNSQEDRKYQVEGRRLHHYRRVFPVIVGAYMILYSILIPLSFKFLLLLGGKTLIISKLALFLAMVGSLRKYLTNAESYPAHSHYHPHPYHHDPYYPLGPPHYHRKAGLIERKDRIILSKKIHHP